MILEHSYVNYPSKYEIVTDGRVLNALKNRGFIIEWDKIHKYINDYEVGNRGIKYNDNEYYIELHDTKGS